MRCYLGVDVGSSKTRALIADEAGAAVGFGTGGPGNPDDVGYDGLAAVLGTAVSQALAGAQLAREQIAGADFGISGCDWPSQRELILGAICPLGLQAPVEAVNDTILGLLAGAAQGWGVAVVSGTGCTCRGWDRARRREGRVVGHGAWLGEAAGARDVVFRALQAVAQEWTGRGPATALTAAFVERAGVGSVEALLEGLTTETIQLDMAAVPLVFQVAARGDAVARADPVGRPRAGRAGEGCHPPARVRAARLRRGADRRHVRWRPAARRADDGEDPRSRAPGALGAPGAPPIAGAVLLGMEQAGLAASERRETLIRSAREMLAGSEPV